MIDILPGIADDDDDNDVNTESEEIKIIVPLKNLSNFIFSLNSLMIDTEIELILKWSQNCVLTEKATREHLDAGDDPATEPEVPAINRPKDLKLKFVLAFPDEEDESSFSKYYTPTVVIKDYNVLIDLQPFYDILIKNKEQTYEAITELFNHDNYTTGNSLTYEYVCNHYKLIAIDLSKQNLEFKNQQINFVGKLEQNATIFFITEELVTAGIKFKQNTLTIV